MASEQTVKIPISLEVIDSSVQNIKDILGKMKPDSAGFRQLSKIMDDLVKSSGKIQASFERGFSSNSEIKAAEKEIRNVEAAMESLNKLSGSISFKDLKLDTNQQKTFDKLEQDLNIAKQHYNDLLKSFGSKENSALIQLVDKDLALRSFDEIQTALTSKVHEMESSAQGLQSIFTKLSEQVNKITEAQKNGSYKQGDAIKNIIGEDAYKDFFLDTQRGISFKGTKAGGKGGAKEAFIEYLKSSFSLTEADLGDIRGAVSAKDLERIFSDGNIISGLTNKISTNLGNGNNLVAQLRNLLNQVNSVGLEMNGAGTALDAFKAKIMSSANVSPELAQALTLVVSKMQELRGNADGAGESLQRMNKQAQMVSNIKSMAERFLGLYQIIGFIKQGFREMTTTIKELDSVMNGISVVTKMSTSDLWGQVDVYSQMAQQYGTSIKGAYEVSRIYYQQGLETKDVMALTEETLKLSKISGLDYATTTDYMTTALRGFKMEMTDASKVVDVYSNLAANTAVSQQELAEAMTRTASSMESVGATFEETSAMIATMVAVTRESASNIGSAMKSIGSRYGELTKDPTKLVDAEGEQMDFNKVDTALRSIGISMHTADGQFRDFTEVILELADAWKTLDSTQQRYVATQFAGNRQQSRFLALVSNGDLLKQNLQVAKNSEDVGTTQALKTLDSIETKINQVTTAWQQFYLNIGLENVWKGALDGITNILNTLNELPKVFGKFPLVAIGAVGNAITLIRSLIDNALTSFSRILPQTAQQVGTEVGTNLGRNMELTWTQSFENIRNKLNVLKADSSLQKQVNPQFLSEAQNSVTKIATALNTVTSLASLFALSMNDGSRSAEVMSGIISGIAGLLQTVGGVFLTFFTGGTGTAVGIPMMLSGLSSMIGGISLLDETIEERVARLTKEAQQLTNIAKQSKSDEKSLENSINKYRELEKSQYESEEAAENFKEISNELAQQFPSLITSLDAVGNATIDATQLDNVLAEARRRSAEATLEAAQAEREKAQADVDKAKNDIKTEREQLYQTANAAVRTSTYQSGYKDQAAYDEIDLQYNIGAAKSDQNYIIRLANTYLEDYTLSSLEEVENHLINGDFDGSDDVKNFIAGYFDSLEYAGAQLDAILSDETATPEAIMAIANNYAKIFRKKAAVERDLWQTGNIWYLLYDKIDKWNNTNQKLEQVQGALSNAEFNELNSNIDKTITNSGVSSVIGTLGKNQIISDYKAAKEKGLPSDMTPSKWYEQLEKNAVLELQEATKGKFTEQQLADLDKYLKDTKHYGSSLELRKALDLTDEKYDVLDTYLTNYYKDISKNYHDLAKGAIETANKKRDNERSQFFTSFKDIVTDNNDEVNSYLEQSTINGLLEYEKVIVKTASGKELSDAGTKAKAVVEQIDQIEEGLADQISSNGFSREGLQKSIKALQATEAYNDVNSIERNLANNLEFLYSLLPDNISLTIQSQIDSASQVIDDITGYASKAVSGVSSMEDAQKMIAFFKSYLPDENISINNLQYSNKKFTLSNAKELLPQLIAAAKNKLAADNKVLNDVNSQIGEDNSNINTFIAQLEDDNAEAKRVLASIDQGLYNEYFDDQGKLKKGASFDKDSIIDAVKKRREEATQLEKNTSILDILLEDIKAEAATVGSVMKEIAANPTKISRDTAGKLKGLNESLFNKLVKDVYGNYSITYEEILEALTSDNEVMQSMTLEDRNAAIAQVKKLQQESSAQAALSDIIASPDKVTEDMLVAYANAWGVNLDIIKEQFIQNADGKTYTVKGSVSDFIERRGMSASDVAIEYANKLYDAVGTVYNGVTSAITNGEASLNNTAEIREVIAPLEQMGIAKLDESLNKWILTVADDNIQEVINAINASDLTQEQKTKNIDSILSAEQSKTFDTVFSSILKDTKNISRDTMQKLADFYGVSVEALLATDAFEFNGQTQAYEVQDKSYLKSILATSAGKISESAYRSLEAQLYVLDNEFNGQAMSFLSNTSIKETDVADILNKYQESTGKNLLEQLDTETVSFSDFINMYFTRDANGNLQIQDNEAFRDLAAQFGLSQEQIQNALIQRISGIISNLSSLSNDIINGFNTPDKMNTVLQELRRSYYKGTTEAGRIIDFDFSDIFEYNDALNKFVYTQTGIVLRVRQLKQQLEQADSNKDAIDAQHQLDMFMVELGQSIDITGYLNLEKGTKEQQKARQELIRNVSNYNAAALEHTDQIAISQEELQEALNGNLTSIENIYKTINKDISSEDLVAIYQQPITKIQGAIDAIEKGGNTIVDETTMYLLGLSGALDFKNSKKITDGKYQVAFKQSITKLGDSYSILYDALKETTQATTQQLNELAAKIAKNQMSKQQAGIELMSNAAEMTIDQFVDIFTSLGVTVDKNFLAADKWGKYLTLLGGDNLQIKDLGGLIKEQKLEGAFSTEKGKEALQAYADSMIEQGNSMHDRLMQIADNLKDAKIGDQINVAGLGLENDPTLKTNIKDGVLTLQSEFIKTVFTDRLLSKNSLGKYLTDIERATIEHNRSYGASERAYAAAKNITDNWDNASFEMLTEFAEANNITMKSLLQTFKRNADGSYSGQGSKIAFATNMGLDKKYIADLRRSANETVDNTISSVIEASIQHLQDGSEQKITVTDENRDILTKLDQMGWGKLEKATNEFIISSISKNVDEVVAAIQGTTGISQSQKNQWISQLYKDQQNRTTSAILSNAFNSMDNLDYETVAQLTDKFGQNFTNYNNTTGIFSLDLLALSQYLEDLDKLPNLLGIRQEALKNAGLDNDSLRAARAQAASLIQSSSVYTRGNALISGRQNISETMINDFLEVADISENELMKYMTKEGDHWTMNDSQALAFAKRIGMTQKEIFETFATSTTSAIDSFGGNIVSGFSNISDMQNIVDTINSHMDWVGKLFAGTPTIDALFEYNESLGKFILSTDGIAAYVNILRKQLDQATDASQKEIVDGQIKQLQKQVKDAVNFDTIFDTGRSSKTRENDRKELIRQLANVNAADKEAGKIIQENIENLFVGGEAAVQAAAKIYEALGKSFTVEDANKFAQMNLSQVDAAREALDNNVGDYITKEAAVLGEAAGYFVVSKPDSNGFVQILKKNKDNLENALRQYYHALLANGEQDIDKLNEAILDIWEEQGNKVSSQNDLLSKASGMTFREFGEGLAAIGITLTENMLQEYIDSDLIEQIEGTNQVRVENFEAFARHIGITDRSSKQYQDMYSQFVDSEIERTTYIQESILSSVNDISDAKAGDKINLSKAIAQFDRATQLGLVQRLEAYGAQYKDGILTISGDTDIFGISKMLLQTASTLGEEVVDPGKIESAMLELQDAIQDAIKGFVDAITGGIKGGITNQGKSDLISFAEKYLGQEAVLTDKDFIAASDGLKLTTDAAIRLYNALKNIEGVDISGVFDSLSESILNRDSIDNMDGILAQIKSLSEQIANADEKGTAAAQAKAAALREELALYQEIAAAGINNPENYNFMNKKLPDGMQGPLNYWQSTAQMFQTMAGSAKSGYMTVQDFYAITTEMEHLAQLSGEQMSFMGMTIGKGAHSAAEIIEAGMSNLSTTAGHAGEINLSGLADMGINLSMSAEDMAAGVEKGIDSAADANIEMLDGLIGVLETIVAMKKLEDVTGDNDEIDIGDIFPQFTVNGNADATGVQQISNDYYNWAKALENQFKTDEKLAKKFEQIKIGNANLRKVIEDAAGNDKKIDLGAMGVTVGQFTEIMEAFRQLNASGGFDSLDDTAAMMRTLAKTGAEIEVQMGDQKVTLTKGKVLISKKNEKGEYEYTMPDGTKTTDIDKVLQAQIQADLKKEIDIANAGREQNPLIVQDKDKEYYINILDKKKYKISVNGKGNYVFEGIDGEYSSLESGYNALIQDFIKTSGTLDKADKNGKVFEFKDMQTWQAEIALGFKIAPKIENASDLTPEMLSRIVQAGYSIDQLEGKEIELGFSIDLTKLTDQQKNDIQSAIENFNKVPITPEVAPINADDIKVEGAIHVFAVIDGFVGADGKINLRNSSGSGYTQVAEGTNLRKALDYGKEDDKKWQAFYANNEWVRERYAPSGADYRTTIGQTEGLNLYKRAQAKNSKLSSVELSAAEAYGKKFVEPIQKFLNSENYKNSVKQAEEQVRESREQWKKEHGGSDEEYDYHETDWYKEAYTPINGAKKSLVDQYKDALKASGEYQNVIKSIREKSLDSTGKYVDWEHFSSLLATEAKAWEIQNKNNNTQDTKLTAADAASALSKAAAQQQLASASLNAAAQALLGASGDIGAALEQYGIEESDIQKWIDSGFISEEYGKKLIEQLTQSVETKKPEENTPTTSSPTPQEPEEEEEYSDSFFAEQLKNATAFNQALNDALRGRANELTSEERKELSDKYIELGGNTEEFAGFAANWYDTWAAEKAVDTSEIESSLDDIKGNTAETAASTNEQAQNQQQGQKEQKELTQEQVDFFGKWGAYLVNPSLFMGDQKKQNQLRDDYNTAFDTQLGQIEAFNAAQEQFYALSAAASGFTASSANLLASLTSISGAAGSAAGAIDATGRSMNNLKSRDISVDVDIKVNTTTAGNGSAETSVETSGATGNVALAAGTRTLMGELGPELVVSNGKYFLAGQNGAEFVDLAKDAIVFNHIQTKRLLANGSSGRGTPLTNERNATSMATGNIHGPAKASAEAVLGQLRAIRAMWESLRDASLSDLAKKGGGGGGGGNKEIPGFIRDVERWYNWLQKIADLEKQITYQEQLRSKIQSDMVSSGDAYFKSQRKTYQDARDSALTSESLFLSQKEYFNKRRQQLNNSPLSELYTFDESGQLHFQDGSYEWLANLFKTDDYGNLKMSPKQQYQAIIKRNRNFAQYMRYDDSGKKINRKDYKSDDEYYVAMVKAFSDRMDSEKEEMQELFDSWNDQQKAVLEQMQAMNEQLQAMKDNQKEVEEAVIGAIEEMREREIDEMQNTRDALEETNQNFIDGLSDQLNKERQMYQNNQNDQELQRNRRQLAILQRSGASASQIAQMQQKIDKQSQDQYFEKQQEQIDAVKEASDNQIEKLDTQIELAQEQLEFEKAHGLLWGQVYEVMARTPQEITDFIKENTEEFWGKSPLANSEDLDNTLFQATQWVAFRDDVEMQNAAMGRIDQNLDIFMGALEQIYGKQANWDKIKKESEAKYKEYWGIDNEDPNATAWDAYPGKNDDIAAHTTNTMGVDTSATTKSSGSSSSGGKNGKEKTWSYNAVYHYHKNWHDGTWSVADATPHSWKVVNSSSRHTTRKCTVCGATRTDDSTPGAKVDGKQYTEQQVADAQALLNKQTKSTKNAKGGIADYTGWTWIDGTLTEPEGILNAEDYKAWKQDIKTTNLLYNALATVSTAQRNTAAATNSIGSQNAGVNIENAVVNMNTTIANDYDARRAGEQALEQMLTIARKSGTRSAQRR